MATYKLFDQPKFHDEAFYQDREVADHIHEVGHRERLMRALHDVLYILDIDKRAKTVADFGCGNGGMLRELRQRRPDVKSWGYDMSPKAVEYARDTYDVNASLLDFTAQPVKVPHIAVLTETLEHLVDPGAFLGKLKSAGVRWVVASVPLGENDRVHYEFHLWAWDPANFDELFARTGFSIATHYHVALVPSQHVIALNLQALQASAGQPVA